MEKLYKEILEKALPYYERGRSGDVEHVKWLFKTIPRFADASVDLEILMLVAILHDVGYSKVEKGSNPFDLDIRKLHSEEGAKIAEEILNEFDYDKDKIKEVKRLILKHDNWAFGDNFEDEPILLLFQNFDFMWMISKDGFESVRRFMKQDKKEFYEQIKKFQEDNVKRGVKWFNKKIENYYKELMEGRKKEL